MKRPLIGITPGLNDAETFLSVNRGHIDALLHEGAMPVLLPLTTDEAALRDAIEAVDGVLFSGGGDIDPELFGEHQMPGCGGISPLRDAMELSLARMLLNMNKPVLGICRGMQVLNIAAGGDIWQDIFSSGMQVLQHRQKQPEQYPAHPVTITADTKLAAITSSDHLMVNSLHHQAVRRVADGFTASAVAPDGLVEAVEMKEHPFFIGVQWHPERLWKTDLASQAMFHAFVTACNRD